jgi:hypothetical protein
MKRFGHFIILFVFAANLLQAQPDAAITNQSVIKMVKAKLSEEIILDMISNSPVDFDLSFDSINALLDAGVPPTVIKAMELSQYGRPRAREEAIMMESEIPVAVAAPKPEEPEITQEKTPPEPHTMKDSMPALRLTSGKVDAYPSKDTLKIQTLRLTEKPAPALPIVPQDNNPPIPQNEQSAFVINTIAYVDPVKSLIIFLDEQTISILLFIKRWDNLIKKSLEEEKNLQDTIIATDRHLIAKKSATDQPFTREITEMKSNLSLLRAQHKQLKNAIIADGKTLATELKSLSGETDKLITAKFSQACKNIKNAQADPSAVYFSTNISIPKQEISREIVHHVAPVSIVPAFFQNKINALIGASALWNAQAKKIIAQDSVLKNQLEPLEKELSQYLASPKQNQKKLKDEISSLKKQCDNISKQRKSLAKQMEEDRTACSDAMKKTGEEIRNLIRARFADAMENIEFSYEDRK